MFPRVRTCIRRYDFGHYKFSIQGAYFCVCQWMRVCVCACVAWILLYSVVLWKLNDTCVRTHYQNVREGEKQKQRENAKNTSPVKLSVLWGSERYDNKAREEVEDEAVQVKGGWGTMAEEEEDECEDVWNREKDVRVVVCVWWRAWTVCVLRFACESIC